MGMGYAGNFAVVIEEQDLAKIVPAAFKKFDEAREFIRDIFEEYARQSSLDDVQDCLGFKTMTAAYEALRAAFKKKTGIDIYLGYHNQEDEGDRYDDLSGVFWSLDFGDCFPASAAFKKLKKSCKKYVGIQHYVTFG